MLKQKFLLIVSIFLSLSAYANDNYISLKNVPLNDSAICFFKPASFIFQINDKNESLWDDSLTTVSEIMLDSLLQTQLTKYHFGPEIIPVKELEKELIHKSILYLNKSIRSRKTKENTVVPTIIDSLAALQQKDYAICISLFGFVRDKQEYRRVMKRSIPIAILSGVIGGFYTVPLKNDFLIKAFLIDVKKHKVLAVSEIKSMEESPLDIKSVKAQLIKVMNGIMDRKPK